MPNRILRDGILASESVATLSWAEEVFYRRLMSVVDDHGRFHSAPKLIRAACYPLLIDKVSDADIWKWLTACVEAALVSVYPALDGKRYIQIIKFGQQVRAKSKFPEPCDACLPEPAISCEQVPANAHLVGVGVEGVISKPSASHPPADAAGPRAASVPCPYEAIVAAYHDILPSLPRVKLMPVKRQAAMRKLWGWVLSSRKSDGARRATNADEALQWLRGYFEHAQHNDFLMGRTSRPTEHAGWQCDLDFLLTDKGMKQVIEKTVEQAAA